MEKGITYTRVSTKEQAMEDRFSLAVQKRLCKEYAEKNNIEIVKIFEDAGRSATNMNRLALRNMLDYIEDNPDINHVLVQDTDRLARNAQDHLMIKAILKKKRVKLTSISQPFIDSSPEGNMIDTILASMNEFQSGITGRKTKKGMEEKALKGWYPGPAPHGYKNTTDEAGNKTIRIDNEVTPYIKMAYKMFATGKYSIKELIEILYKKGFRSKNGLKISISKMIYILKNDFYIGEMHWGKINIKGAHTPIINRLMYNQVQAVFANHNHHACRKRKYNYLLRGYLYCSCNSRLTAGKFKNKTHDYYYCVNRSQCSESYIPADDIEKQVENLFKKIQFSDDFINMVMSEVKKGYREMQKFNKDIRRKLINDKTALEQKRNVAEDKLLKNILDDEAFSRIRQNIETQIDEIDNQLSKIKYKRDLDINKIQEILNFTRNIHSAYVKAPKDLKKQYLGLFFHKLMVGNKKITKPILNPLFDSLIKARKSLYKTQKPSLKEKVYVPSSNSYPKKKVKIRNRWGA